MYLRQMKQFIRSARPDFDERRYGSLPELLRACQKDGLLRLERDRQGGLRAFAGASKPAGVRHGWGSLGTESNELEAETGDVAADTSQPAEDAAPVAIEAQLVEEAAPEAEPEDDQLAVLGAMSSSDAEPKARRPVRRGRKVAEPRVAAERPRRPRAKAAVDAPRRRAPRKVSKA
jgi:hypothetical protein